MVVAPLFGLFTGMPGIPELIIVAVIVLLLFGKRLPGAMRSLGSSITEFKKGINDPDSDPNSDNVESTKTKDS